MLAIAQSGNHYHYVNWIASEVGPKVTHYGKIIKPIENVHQFERHHFDILEKIMSYINSDEPICTYSLDSNNFIFFTNYIDQENSELGEWYMDQYKDQSSLGLIDYYFYPINQIKFKNFSIGVPSFIRQSFQYNFRKLEARLNCLSVGIFSAEQGARSWFQADKLETYLIWKTNKKKDEMLLINNKCFEAYFSINRFSNDFKINWYHGNKNSVENLCKNIKKKLLKKSKKEIKLDKIFAYTCDSNKKDIKELKNIFGDDMTLLNPLSKLEIIDNEKFDVYETLPFAETGNSFGKIDV